MSDIPNWIECTERLPAPNQIVEVKSLSWNRPRWLAYRAVPQGFVDPLTGIRFWYPERMKWRPDKAMENT